MAETVIKTPAYRELRRALVLGPRLMPLDRLVLRARTTPPDRFLVFLAGLRRVSVRSAVLVPVTSCTFVATLSVRSWVTLVSVPAACPNLRAMEFRNGSCLTDFFFGAIECLLWLHCKIQRSKKKSRLCRDSHTARHSQTTKRGADGRDSDRLPRSRSGPAHSSSAGSVRTGHPVGAVRLADHVVQVDQTVGPVRIGYPAGPFSPYRPAGPSFPY